MIIYYTEKHIFNFEDFLNTSLSKDQELATYANILNLKMSDNLQEIDEDLVQNEVNSWIRDLKKHYIKNQLKSIEEKLRNAEQSDNKDDIEKYSNQFTAITADLKQVE